MFSFETLDRCLYNGIESGDISEFVEQRFVLHFGNAEFDNRFYVILGRENIRFFYYDCEHPNPQNIINVDFLKELGCISLTNPKDTGNDILLFPQMMCNKIINKPQNENDEKTIIEIQKSIFYSFPFWNEYDNYIKEKESKEAIITKDTPWNKVLKLNPTIKNFTDWDFRGSIIQNNIDIPFLTLVKSCFLTFIFQIEDRNEIFAVSPLYDHVRSLLRKSDVYKLLSAKLQYTLYVPQNGLAYNTDEYSYKVQKFADALMDEKFNKVISPDNFTNKKKGAQGWFYNPEKELECLLKKNRYQTKNNKVVILEESVVSKIRSFLFSRHAVDKANTTVGSKMYFWIAQALMLVANCLIVISAIYFKTFLGEWFYKHFEIVPILFVLVFCCIYISGKINKSWANALFPRILVAEAAAWLTIGIAEDLVKSMLWIEEGLIGLFLVVLAIVGLLVFGESKQHSPYLHKNINRWKTTLIMNHSLFFALSFGCIMQLFFYNNLLENSDALSSVVYKDHFGKTSSYLQQLENLDESIKDYQQFARSYELTQTTHHSTTKNKNIIEGTIKTEEGVSSDISLSNSVSSNSTMISSLGGNIYDYHDNFLINNLKDNIMRILRIISDKKKRVNNRNDFGLDIEKGEHAIVCLTNNEQVDSIKPDSIIKTKIKNNIQWMNDIMPNLKKEMQEVRNHLMNDEYNTLIEWATYKSLENEKDTIIEEGYLGFLTQDVQKKKCCIIISDNPLNMIEGKRFFPNLLLVHTLIVLVLAFITQLIISDKSVTEPL